jgi:hypothetical protein
VAFGDLRFEADDFCEAGSGCLEFAGLTGSIAGAEGDVCQFGRVGVVGFGLLRGLRQSLDRKGKRECQEETKLEEAKARRSTVSLCGIPPIEQKALDGWGTQSFIP